MYSIPVGSTLLLLILIQSSNGFQLDNLEDSFVDNNNNWNVAESRLAVDDFIKNEVVIEPRFYILEEKEYSKSLLSSHPKLGQVSGIASQPSGNVAIFQRADRHWTKKTFDVNTNNLLAGQSQENLIKDDTIILLDAQNGSFLTSLGSNLFWMPHGIASDSQGNVWVSDVARHQVMRLPTSQLLEGGNDSTRIWPDIVLGDAFVSGQDSLHFCKPAEIEVSSDDRLVFVADGYCNGRVMVFSGSGKFVTSFGEDQGLEVVHSLALIEERNLICLADRENSRILCHKAGLDGDLNSIGDLVLRVEYPLGKVYAISELSANHVLVSSLNESANSYDLAVLNLFSGKLRRVKSPEELAEPHSMSSSRDRRYVYLADLSDAARKKVFKFNVIQSIE